MIVSLAHGFVFIKGVKVGGSSVEIFLSHALGEDAIVAPANLAHAGFRARNYRRGEHALYNHATAREARTFLGPACFEALRRVLIVRNPYEKVRSYFYFKLAQGRDDFTIDEAIATCSSEAVRALDETGRSLLTDVLYYERLDHDLAAFFAAVGVPFGGRLEVFEKAWQRKRYGHIPVRFTPAQAGAIHARFAFEFGCYADAGIAVSPDPAAVPSP